MKNTPNAPIPMSVIEYDVLSPFRRSGRVAKSAFSAMMSDSMTTNCVDHSSSPL